MSHRLYNSNIVTSTFTGMTNTAINGATLHIGENQRDLTDLSAHIIATITMTNATVKAVWQVSNDASTWVTCAHDSANQAGVALATGVASGTTLAVGAPQGAYGYKYCRATALFGSTTAGTTNDTISIGYNYRQLDAGAGL